jgi:hypothetical protein
VEQEEMAIAMKWFDKHISVAKIEVMLFYVVCAKAI